MGQADRTTTRLFEQEQDASKPIAGIKGQPETPVFVECLTSVHGGISAMASADAPYLYFDGAPFFGIEDGICEITLVARRRTAQTLAGPVGTDFVTVGHLRCGVEALRRLHEAIGGIATLSQPSPSEVAN